MTGPAGTVRLRPALLADRERTWRWAADSDATSSMMGPPHFPDHPVMTLAEFERDYTDSFFAPEGDGYGRMFIVLEGDREVGCVSYDGLEDWHGIAELDAWIASSADQGRGIGSRAIALLAERLLEHPGVDALLVRPSARNARAVAAYRRAGFVPAEECVPPIPDSVLATGNDYADAVALVRVRRSAASRPSTSRAATR